MTNKQKEVLDVALDKLKEELERGLMSSPERIGALTHTIKVLVDVDSLTERLAALERQLAGQPEIKYSERAVYSDTLTAFVHDKAKTLVDTMLNDETFSHSTYIRFTLEQALLILDHIQLVEHVKEQQEINQRASLSS